jgi:TusA-related sulfurtransferase
MRRIFREPWPVGIAGAAIGMLATLAIFRGAPLGVTAELARATRAAGDALHLLPKRLEGLDEIAGCRPTSTDAGLSDRGLFLVALVAGSLVAALAAGEFRPRLARGRVLVLALLGGALLGFGAFVASGCTVGALLSGVMAFSLHGWVFAAGLLAGAFLGVTALRRIVPRATSDRAAIVTLDLRGESCGMPEVRLAALLDTKERADAFAVLADDAATLERLLPLAASRGFTAEVSPSAAGVRAELRRSDGSTAT